MNKLQKLAASWNVSTDKMTDILVDNGFAPEVILKLAEVAPAQNPAMAGMASGAATGGINDATKNIAPGAPANMFAQFNTGVQANTQAQPKTPAIKTAAMLPPPHKTLDSVYKAHPALKGKSLDEVSSYAASNPATFSKKFKGSRGQAVLEELHAHSKAMSELAGAKPTTPWGRFKGRALESMPGALVGLGTTAAMLGGLEAARAHREHKEEGDKEKHFKAMLASHPDLEAHPEEKVRSYYETLHRTSKHIAKDPHLAGSWIKSHIRYSDEGVPMGSIKDLSEIENLKSRQSDDLAKNLSTAASLAKMVPGIGGGGGGYR